MAHLIPQTSPAGTHCDTGNRTTFFGHLRRRRAVVVAITLTVVAISAYFAWGQ